VAIRATSGARVVVLDHEACVEIYKVRERLEPLALSGSLQNPTQGQLASIAEGAQPRASSAQLWCLPEADRNLHFTAYAGATPRLLKMIETFWSTTQHYRRLLLTTWTTEDCVINDHEHGPLANAILEHNSRAGEDILRLHLESARSRLTRRAALFDREA